MSGRRKIIAKLRNKYRLVLFNDSSFGEVFSLRLTPMNVLMIFSSTFVLFAILIFMLIALTPMRQLVPGYGKSNDPEAWLELNQKVQDLDREMKDKQLKIDALNNLLSEKEALYDSTSVKRGAK